MRTLALLLSVLLSGAPAACRAGPPIWMLARSLRARVQGVPFAGLAGPLDPASPGAQCRAAIAAQEALHAIPPHLLGAIGRVESGRANPSGGVDPWPWSIDVEGVDHVYDTKAEAIAAVRGFQARGVLSIDVGCLQVNLMYHPDAFASLEDAFDPAVNAAYAARFLVQLHEQTGNWTTATAWYHSATPELGSDYARRVMAALPEEQARPSQVTPPTFARSAAGAPGPGPYMLANATIPPRLGSAPGGAGRGLAAYRAAPIRIATTVLLH